MSENELNELEEALQYLEHGAPVEYGEPILFHIDAQNKCITAQSKCIAAQDKRIEELEAAAKQGQDDLIAACETAGLWTGDDVHVDMLAGLVLNLRAMIPDKNIVVKTPLPHTRILGMNASGKVLDKRNERIENQEKRLAELEAALSKQTKKLTDKTLWAHQLEDRAEVSNHRIAKLEAEIMKPPTQTELKIRDKKIQQLVKALDYTVHWLNLFLSEAENPLTSVNEILSASEDVAELEALYDNANAHYSLPRVF